MTKLKTLKDLEIKGHRQKTVACIKLKQEAIKWARSRNHILDSDWCEFFNITEEDLK